MIDTERFSKAARFVREAVENGAHIDPPQARTKLFPNWVRNIDITSTYLFGGYEGRDNNRLFSLEEVGRIFPLAHGPISREAVRQVVSKTVSNLWEKSPELHEEYPSLDDLKKKIGKPPFLTIPERTTRDILEDIDGGSGYEDLSKKYSARSRYLTRQILEPFGIEVPLAEGRTKLFMEEIKNVSPDTDTPTLTRLLGQVNRGTFLNGFYGDFWYTYFISLSGLLKDLGFRLYNKAGYLSLFKEILEQNGVPVGHQQVPRVKGKVEGESQEEVSNYYYVFRVQEQNIKDLTLNDPQLQPFLQGSKSPIRQVTGEVLASLPSTYELQKRDNYKGILPLARSLGIKAGGRGINVSVLLQGSQGSAFVVLSYESTRDGRNKIMYFYQKSDKEALARHLLEQADKLGLVK